MITLASVTALMFLGVPLVVAICLSAMVFSLETGSTVLFDSFLHQLFGGINSYGLIAFPLFVFVGEIMNVGGITQRLFKMATAFLGSVRGGLAYINLVANMMLAAILGSAAAQTAIMTRLMVPEMERRGYTREFAVGLTVTGGLLSPIIPPSITFVVFGVIAQVAIGDMFLAGILPGLLLGFGIFACIAVMGMFNPFPSEPRMTWGERAKAAAMGIPALMIPVAITGSIATGFASPTESAAFAALMSLIVSRIYGTRFGLVDVWRMLQRAGTLSGMVLFLVAVAAVLSWVLIYGKVPQHVASWIQTVAHGPVSFMLIVNLIVLFLGSVLDGIPALIMTVPILLPIATDVYGIDPIHFGVVICINVVLGLASPPVGIVLFIASAATGMKPGAVFKAMLPYLASCLIGLTVLSIFPWFSLALVR